MLDMPLVRIRCRIVSHIPVTIRYGKMIPSVVQHDQYVETIHMQTLTRQSLIQRLQAARNEPAMLQQLSGWAFDHFYAEEEGNLEFEPGYRATISSVLDDLMFGDEAAFALTTDDVARLIRKLETATPTDDDAEYDNDE